MSVDIAKKPIGDAVTLRPVTANDEPFLLRVYTGTRERELALVDWLDVQKQAFIKMQFTLQQQSYKKQFPGADHSIILFEEEPIGQTMIDRTIDDEIRGVDWSLLASHRNSGIGTHLLRQWLAEAAAAGKPFRFQVDKYNHDAMRLYLRLGCYVTGESPTHIAMEWRAGKAERSKQDDATVR